jgi:chemotaxis protein CheD
MLPLVVDYLKSEAMEISTQDVGEDFTRRVIFYASTGKVLVSRTKDTHARLLVAQELIWGDTSKEQVDFFKN